VGLLISLGYLRLNRRLSLWTRAVLRAGRLRRGEHTAGPAMHIDEMPALAGIQPMRAARAVAFAFVLMVECCRGCVAWGLSMGCDDYLV
jgi:hypothetical protein